MARHFDRLRGRIARILGSESCCPVQTQPWRRLIRGVPIEPSASCTRHATRRRVGAGLPAMGRGAKSNTALSLQRPPGGRFAHKSHIVDKPYLSPETTARRSFAPKSCYSDICAFANGGSSPTVTPITGIILRGSVTWLVFSNRRAHCSCKARRSRCRQHFSRPPSTPKPARSTPAALTR